MAGRILTAEEVFSEQDSPQAPSVGGKRIFTADEVFGTGVEPKPAVTIPSIDDEHHGRFLQDFGAAIHKEMLDTAIRFTGGVQSAESSFYNVIGTITGLNSFKKYRENFVGVGAEFAEQAREVAPGDNFFEKQYFGLVDTIGNMSLQIPLDVMTGQATKLALAGRILPKMESMLRGMPDFVLGSGWGGMVEGIQGADSVPEAVVGGVVGAGERMAWNGLFASSGGGLKGIGKMASLGLAQAFFNAAKEGRTPTVEEMTDSTTQAAMLGVVFTALPHLAEGSRGSRERKVLQQYEKQVQSSLPVEIVKDIPRTVSVKRYWDMPVDKLQTEYESLKAKDAQIDVEVFGPEGAKRYRQLQRQANSSYDMAKADKASAEIDAMEKGLTEVQRNKLFGIGSDYVDPADIKGIISGVNSIGGDTPAQLGYSLKYAMTRLPDKGKLDSQWTASETVAMAQFQTAVRIATSQGWDLADVSKAAIQGSAARFSDVEDAMFMLKRFLEPKSVDPTVITEIVESLFSDERIRPEIRESLAQPFLDMMDARGSIAPMEFRFGMWKDRSKLRMYRETMERNIENVAGPDAKAVQAETTERVKENETARARWQSAIMRDVRGKEMVGKGIRPGTKESMLMMRYGEGRMTEKELQLASPDKWGEIEQAAAYSRRVYDESLDAHNAVRKQYGYSEIQKHPDYFRHFQELNLANEMFGIMLGGKKPPTEISGVLDRAKYGKPFSSVEYERKGGPFTEDGVKALQNYIKAAGQQIFHLDSVQRVRALENAIRKQALVNEVMLKDNIPVAKLDLSNFVENLTQYADILAGQPSTLTQAVKGRVDRPLIAGIRALQRNVVANMIGDNISATFMNLLPVTQGVATTSPKALVRGLVTSGLHLHHEVPFEFEGVKSEFYDRRYPVDFLPSNWIENLVEHSFVLPKVFDRFIVQTLIAGKYYEGRGQGLNPKEAMKAADNYTVRVVADRTKGQLPNVMSEPDLKMFSAFQTEINNLWSWMAHDVAGNNKALLRTKIGQMAVFAIASNVINGLYEKMMGRRPQLDFLYILGTLFGVTKSGQNRAFLDRVAPAGKDFLGNVPFGNLFIDGGRFPLPSTLPDMNVVLQDPEHRAMSEFLKPALYWHPFGGGGQARKTWEGLQAWNQGYVATPSGNIRYEVAKDFSNFVRGFLFGKNAFPEAVAYWATPPEER